VDLIWCMRYTNKDGSGMIISTGISDGKERVKEFELTDKGEEGHQQKNNVDTGTHLEMIEDEYDLLDNGDLVLVSSKVVKIDSCGNEIPLLEADGSSQN
jgi:hypothetical protein